MERPRPSKRLGQNFLRARWVARLFARWACGYRRLLEVGPGTGFVTSIVLRECSPALLVGVEVDHRLLEELQALSMLEPSLQVIHGDALHAPAVLAAVDAVYGSIPYNITGPLLGLLAIESGKPAMLLLQREVVDRLAARPGSSRYGRITVLVRLVYQVEPGPVVPPSAFHPRPRVYSRLVTLTPRPVKPEPEALRRVEELTRCMFSMRNKKASKAAVRCGVEPQPWLGERRVYQLAPEEFLELALSDTLAPAGGAARPTSPSPG